MVLAESKLHEEQWDAANGQHDDVGYEKGTATILEAQIRETPYCRIEME